jgi:hypothetical protein
MVVIHALGRTATGAGEVAHIEAFDGPPPGKQTLSAAEVRGLRKSYGVDEQNYAVLLIGKDGGVKLRREVPVTTTELFSLIDSMPMRKREMRESDK